MRLIVVFPVRSKTPRRSSPAKKTNYRSYKPDLKTDFNDSCGYCGIHHVYFGCGKAFHIDHFAPKSMFKSLECEYENLVYSCPICNIAKSDDWPSNDSSVSIKDGKGFIDPCSYKFDENFYRDASGKIKFHDKEPAAEYMHKKLKLGLKRHEIFWLADYFQKAVQELLPLIDSLDDEAPIKSKISKVFMDTVKQMNKYVQLTRSI